MHRGGFERGGNGPQAFILHYRQFPSIAFKVLPTSAGERHAVDPRDDLQQSKRASLLLRVVIGRERKEVCGGEYHVQGRFCLLGAVPSLKEREERKILKTNPTVVWTIKV